VAGCHQLTNTATWTGRDDRGGRDLGCPGGLGAVPEAVDDDEQGTVIHLHRQVAVAGDGATMCPNPGRRPLHDVGTVAECDLAPFCDQVNHFRIVTIVPPSTPAVISSSSISRPQPGRPRPRLPPEL
jgi:hypothetical protein